MTKFFCVFLFTKRRSLSCLLLLATAAVAPPACAHHSGAMFDQTKTVTVAGTVSLFDWASPHSWIELMVADSSGGAERKWSVEMGPPSALYRKGWRPGTLKPGDRLVVTIHPVRSGLLGGSFLSAHRADGTKLGED